MDLPQRINMTETSVATGELEQLQRFMQAALLQQAPDTDADQVQLHITPSANLSAAQRLAIYQRAYYARLLQCMQGQFKALSHALEPALFADFAREYLREIPSRSPTLANLGHDFAAFLQRNRPDAETTEKEIWVDFMIDLADFEWTLYGLFDAPGIEQEGYADTTNLDDPRLRLQTCMRLCHYRFPVNEYYQQVANGGNPEFPLVREVYLALVRKNYQIGIFTLLPAQHHFLTQLSQLSPLQNITDALANTASVFKRDIDSVKAFWSMWQHGWLQAGFFCKPV
ncbi:MAG: DNA-binding domain-containing protein [Pseudomonadota bacterium]